jgi:hypothetical protein
MPGNLLIFLVTIEILQFGTGGMPERPGAFPLLYIVQYQ